MPRILTLLFLALVSLFVVHGRNKCPKGWFFVSKNGTGVERCCQSCPEGANMVEVCTANKTTRCDPCQIGEYFDQGTFICVACTNCPEGYEVISNCVLKRDTKCQPCSPGTFSNTTSYDQRCQKCTTCPGGFFEAHNCSAVRDTSCNRTTSTVAIAVDKSTMPPHTGSQWRSINTTRSTNKSPKKTRQTVWSILIGVLVVIIVLIITLIVVFCYWKRVLCFQRDVASGHRRQSSKRGLIKTQKTHQPDKGDPEEGLPL